MVPRVGEMVDFVVTIMTSVLLFLQIRVFPAHMYAYHGHSMPKGTREEHWSCPLELELEIILSPSVDAGNQTWVLCKAASVLDG